MPRRGDHELAGALVCYRPYACADGGSRSARWSRSSGGLVRGVGRGTSIEQQFARPGTTRTREVEAIFLARTRAEWDAFAAEHDCCLEPVLESTRRWTPSWSGRARWSSSSISRAPAAGAPARHAGEALPHAGRREPRARAGAGRAHREVLAGAGYGARRSRR